MDDSCVRVSVSTDTARKRSIKLAPSPENFGAVFDLEYCIHLNISCIKIREYQTSLPIADS